MRPGWVRRVAPVLVGATLALGAIPGAAAAQDPAAEVSAAGTALQPLPISPGGAFLRSVLIPGWGHAEIGAYTRGGFYFAFEAATAYTLVRTWARLDDARARTALRESALRARLALEGVTDPTEIESRLDQDATLAEYRNLVRSRTEQREDLMALGIFLLFISGADAYVSAHLARFPAPIELQLTPSASGRTDVGFSVPLPNLP